jgi:hypothetical protein
MKSILLFISFFLFCFTSLLSQKGNIVKNFMTLEETIENTTKKEPLTLPELGMKVYHEKIYGGKELMTVVGIRKTEIELEGDYSGGTHNVIEKDWLPIEGAFRLRKVCEQQKQPGGCQLPNVHCSYPNCEPYV